MKKTKRKAVINLIIFFLLLAGGIYMAIAGVGQNESGKTANVPLGLDLQGGLSVTYEIQDEKPTSDEIKATVDKLQRRVDSYSSEGEVYQEGDDRITVEIPLNTEKVDAHDVLDQLGQPGQLLFLDSENYTIWQKNQNNGTNDAYEAVLTGSDIKYAQAGVREYWLIDPDKQNVLVYDLKNMEFPSIYGFDAKIPVTIFGGECKVNMRDIQEYMENVCGLG